MRGAAAAARARDAGDGSFMGGRPGAEMGSRARDPNEHRAESSAYCGLPTRMLCFVCLNRL